MGSPVAPDPGISQLAAVAAGDTGDKVSAPVVEAMEDMDQQPRGTYHHHSFW